MLRPKDTKTWRIAVDEVNGKHMKGLLAKGDVVLKFNDIKTPELKLEQLLSLSTKEERSDLLVEMATNFTEDLIANSNNDRKLLIMSAVKAAA